MRTEVWIQKKKKSWPNFCKILGRSEKGNTTIFFRPNFYILHLLVCYCLAFSLDMKTLIKYPILTFLPHTRFLPSISHSVVPREAGRWTKWLLAHRALEFWFVALFCPITTHDTIQVDSFFCAVFFNLSQRFREMFKRHVQTNIIRSKAGCTAGPFW